MATRGREILKHIRGKKSQFVPTHDIEQHIPVVLAESKAVVMHAGNAGFLYINLKGRQPGGIVDPSEYEAMRDDLIARFRGGDCQVRAPWGDEIDLFPEVYKPEDVYGCSREDEPWMPDLLLIQHETLAVVRRMRGRHVVQWLPYNRLEGTHRKEGVFIATGPGITRKIDVSAHLVDCAPTLLAMLGLRIPHDMTGRVVTEIFESPLVIETEHAREASAGAQDRDVYSEKDLQQVTDRLADLGYLE